MQGEHVGATRSGSPTMQTWSRLLRLARGPRRPNPDPSALPPTLINPTLTPTMQAADAGDARHERDGREAEEARGDASSRDKESEEARLPLTSVCTAPRSKQTDRERFIPAFTTTPCDRALMT